MIDYVSFINSETIKKYYKEMGVEKLDLSLWEVFSLITRSVKTTYAEKISALKYLEQVATEDYKMNSIEDGIKLLQDCIYRHIILMERYKNHLEAKEDDTYYCCSGDYFDKNGKQTLFCSDDKYSSFEDALKDSYKFHQGNPARVYIDKFYNDRERYVIQALVREPGKQLINVRSLWYSDMLDVYESMNVILEAPFEKGDIVKYVDSYDMRNDIIFVLDHIEQSDNVNKKYLDGKETKHSIYGYFLDDKGKLVYDTLSEYTNENLELVDISQEQIDAKYIKISEILKPKNEPYIEWWEKPTEEFLLEVEIEIAKNKGIVLTEQEMIEEDAEAGYRQDDD